LAKTELSIESYGVIFWSLASALLIIVIALGSAQYYMAASAVESTTYYSFAPHSSALLYSTLLAFVIGFAFLLAAILSIKSRRAGPAISSILSAILIIVDIAIGFVWSGYGALIVSVSFVTLFFSYRMLTARRKAVPNRQRAK
jgi:hypothetical protein